MQKFVTFANFFTLVQGSPNFFVRGSHKLLLNSPRAEYLTQCDCSGICYILPNQQIFRSYIIFPYWQNAFAGRSLETLP